MLPPVALPNDAGEKTASTPSHIGFHRHHHVVRAFHGIATSIEGNSFTN